MDQTICAISTALGVGAISIIRISGKNTIPIVNKIFKGKDLQKVPSHTIHYGYIVDNEELIDEVLLMLMKAPKTYTKEDVIEINCHGGINSTNKIMEVLLKNGCTLSEPGEFTKRAFLNGRINLLEAESVQDLIISKTDASRSLALNNVTGLLTTKIKNIRRDMVKIIANIEVNIDYPEYEDEIQVTKEMLNDKLLILKKELDSLVEGSKNGKLIKEGINIAIIGKPNVGKSSILNNLLDEEKAIVTNIPGTTRDIVEGSISLKGVKLNFIDTAGIRKTDDLVEIIGVTKSLDIANKADLILFVLNNNEEITAEELELMKQYTQEKMLVFINKNDLEKKLVLNIKNTNIVYGNTKSFDGLKNLKEEIVKLFNLDKIVGKDMSYLSNVRQIDLINKASDALQQAFNSLQNGYEVDVVEIDLKSSWNFLGELIGETYSEELVDNIFANFCLGK
ncbi:MAG: tRNA uridine-5-carboxymethylaminomethyl(34) synthesis GTPase MnmE [Firmicutes bacterium]|nr:tRNA uridine-5-carboxymethylaminomethyl(34) synthesis GTPase MnmE [Bacillota bacterium]